MKKNQRKIGVIMSYLAQFIQILTGILYTPIMLRLLGQSEYGLYQLVFSVVSYLSLLSFGFVIVGLFLLVCFLLREVSLGFVLKLVWWC